MRRTILVGFALCVMVTMSSLSFVEAQSYNHYASESYSVSAGALTSEYEANEVEADDKYKNKVIVVEGVIDTIGKDILRTPYVVLKGSGSFGVQCMFDYSALTQSSLKSLKRGE